MAARTINAETVRDFILASAETDIEKNLPAIAESVGLWGRSDAVLQVTRQIINIAPSDVSVLIVGESGTGKDLVAKALHRLSPRRNYPLVIVNSGAIAEGILESELFGHERGAFTGAVSERKGYFETANGGTIFLDEIGEMPLTTQVKLLRILETGEFLKVGGSVTKKCDVRVIAATNRNLEHMVRKGEFRKDLYYRLKAITIALPPLRARKSDIPILAEKFADDFIRSQHAAFEGFTNDAMDVLTEYRWPGNVRELKNFVESLITIKRGARITAEDVSANLQHFRSIDHEELPDDDRRFLPVPTHLTPEQAERELLYRTLLALKQDITDIKQFLWNKFGAAPGTPVPPVTDLRRNYENALANSQAVEPEEFKVDEPHSDLHSMRLSDAERETIIKALRRFDGKRSLAAKALGLSERTLYRKIKQYHLDL